MLILLFFAFVSGLVTILAPCIWPLLPIVLSSAASGKGKARPLGITLGIMLSFGFFTLAISFLVNAFHLDQNVLRMVAVIVLGFLGLTLLIPKLTQVLESVVSGLSGKWGQRWQNSDSGQARTSSFIGGFITGLSLGIVWAPCAGPIFASIAALSIMGHISLELVLITIVYVSGIGIPLFIFALAGQRLLQKSRMLSPYTARIQQVFGLIILLLSLAIYTNYDKVIEAKLLNVFPSYSNALTSFEKSQAVTQQLNSLKGKGASQSTQNADIASDTCQAIPLGSQMPEFSGIMKWLNLSSQTGKIPPSPFLKGGNEQQNLLTVEGLKGKVVLVDFWTYTCINCIRTLPYVTSWYDKYKDKGFVVIGVHTPEFDFEKNTNNVMNAIDQYKIHYPVAQDNKYDTWNAYNNQYWPAEYLFDSKGVLRRAHCGEGEYDQMESAIVSLLKESGEQAVLPSVMPTNYALPNQISPETYLGSKRMQYYYPGGSLSDGMQNFTLTKDVPLNSFSYGGQWDIESENAVAGKNAVLNYHFSADKVYIILRPPQGSTMAKVKILLDGKMIDSSVAGADVHNGEVTVDKDRLYNIVNLGSQPAEHIVQLEFETPGIQVYTFTFG